MLCVDCGATATHEIAFDVEVFFMCGDCFIGAMQECVARNVLPSLIGSF